MNDRITSGPMPAKPGAALRALRMRRGWTLAEVSRRTGLSVPTLSKIENDKIALTYDKLARISRSLEVDISVLFGAEAAQASASAAAGRRSITRAGEGRAIETEVYGHLFPAADLLNKRFIPIVAEIRARSLEEFGEMIRHDGEEFAYVLEGELDLYTDQYTPARLGVGDSIYFNSGMAHAYVAVGDSPCRVLSICSGAESQIMELSESRTGGAQPTSLIVSPKVGRRRAGSR